MMNMSNLKVKNVIMGAPQDAAYFHFSIFVPN